MNHTTIRKQLRKEKIQARNNLTLEERNEFSKLIAEQILKTQAFQKAHTIMIYRAIKREVRLDALETLAKDKRFVYPLCLNHGEMIALAPNGPDAWKDGYCGIQEPVLEQSIQVSPEEIDMVICPCTAFDETGNRLGMGAGFYDRYLEKCTNAIVTAVAFEVQKTKTIPVEWWDKKMEMVFTEKGIYFFTTACFP